MVRNEPGTVAEMKKRRPDKPEMAGEDRPLSMEPIRLVAIDLDGTLLRTDGSICFRAAETIYEASQRGVKVVISTGRAPRAVKAIYEALDLDTLQICHNGAVIDDPRSGESHLGLTLDPAVARRVVQIARALGKEMALGVEIGDRCYTDSVGHKSFSNEPSVRGTSASDPKHGDTTALGIAALTDDGGDALGALGKVLDQAATKLMMVGEPYVLGGLESTLRDEFGDELSFAFSHMRLLQVGHRDADKAHALEYVANHYGIPRAGVLAIGDAPNDLGMIRWAGTGVALGNAWKDVQSAAHFVVPSNDDEGVARAMRRFVLMD
jgi:Cof subfamily protein (haloacid dehalogenase superfamily)